ncbi:MAG: hypothetical protein LC117_04910 [Bacteroidia bacterium]|nr:hypothetical protein [Bacteroidia bacterium]MCZ2277250.1 hypothetical protein [Bacteroidia bacterium]
MRLFSYNHFLLGFITGLLLPVIGSLLFYLIFFSYLDIEKFVIHVITTGHWIEVLSLGVILNLGAFFLFLKYDSEMSSRGVVGATFIFAFLAAYFKAF